MTADMTVTIIPKSDQLNADDLIAGPRTISITRVAISPGAEQPVDVHYRSVIRRGHPPLCHCAPRRKQRQDMAEPPHRDANV